MKTADGNIIPIPKMRQKTDKLENQGSFVYRSQFPILLGYAVTVHRVEGATLKETHLYLDQTMFFSKAKRMFHYQELEILIQYIF